MIRSTKKATKVSITAKSIRVVIHSLIAKKFRNETVNQIQGVFQGDIQGIKVECCDM
jgi:hypothetical protein